MWFYKTKQKGKEVHKMDGKETAEIKIRVGGKTNSVARNYLHGHMTIRE